MPDPEPPLFADARDQLAQLGAELREMATLRWRLARLELDAAAASLRRLAVGWAVAAVMGMTGLSVLTVWLANLLAESTPLAQATWLAIFWVALLLGGAVVGWLAWRRFRRRYVGLEETLEELREDLVWLREWSGGGDEESATGE